MYLKFFFPKFGNQDSLKLSPIRAHRLTKALTFICPSQACRSLILQCCRLKLPHLRTKLYLYFSVLNKCVYCVLM